MLNKAGKYGVNRAEELAKLYNAFNNLRLIPTSKQTCTMPPMYGTISVTSHSINSSSISIASQALS